MRCQEVSFPGDGKLILRVEEQGIRGVWSGPDTTHPPRLTAYNHAGERQEVTWQRGPEGHLHRAEPLLPWVDGQVVLELGTEPPRRLTIQR